MTCNALETLIPLYPYGELSPEQEEQVEEHLHLCRNCTRELERQRALMRAFESRRIEPSNALLEDCRRDLMMSVYRDQAHAKQAKPGFLQTFGASVSGFFQGMSRFRQPIGAVALVAVGFFAARFTGTTPGTPTAAVAVAPGVPDQFFATVRSVQPDASGKVQILFDETRRRSISGHIGDDQIQRLLLAAARDDNNAAVRVQSVGLLKGMSDSGEIRGALLNALANDPNAGVRLKAVEGLKPLSADPQVRNTLAQVLLSDDNPAVRMQVIDLLVEHRDGSIVGVLQNVVQKENNNYVRLKCEKALKDMNASIGTF